MATDPPSRRLDWRDALYDWAQSSVWLASLPSVARRRHERHEGIYDAPYFEFVESAATWSRDVMADSIVRDLAPRNVVDLGCGTGALLEALALRSVHVTGLEYSEAALTYCHERNLPVYKFDIAQDHLPHNLCRTDLALSFEVAEHLPASLANRFVNLLSAASNTVVLSAATPGQGGTDHVNEQPHEYWIKKMARRGLSVDWDLSLHWRDEWRGKTADWYHANVMVFRRSRT